MKITMIDPPSGWRYGFPKPYTPKENQNMVEWLRENGYPEKEIKLCGNHLNCRFWETEE